MARTKKTAAAATDPLWDELLKLEGVSRNKIRQHIEELVSEPARGTEWTPPKRSRDYQHPEKADMPEMHRMLTDLSLSDEERGFGSGGYMSANKFALRAETELYNAWVELQCRKHGLRSPGELSEDQFCDRYWEDRDDD